MTFDNYEHLFRSKASKAGYSEENVQKCLNYARPLIENNLPVIFNTSNLSVLVGYRKNFIKRAVLYTDYFYRSFPIKKKNKKPRYLKEPLPSLKEIQIWILEELLYSIPVSRFAKAYVQKRSLLDNVKYHKGKETVLSLDIKDFFTNIKRPSIEQIFQGVGYSSNVANLLSKLCCCDEYLPQGAPTSPYLSNLYLRTFDSQVSKYAVSNNLRYTRYADDITLSGKMDINASIEYVNTELSKLSLKLNKEKVKVMGQNVRQEVTGIVVNDAIQAPKSYRDKIRQEIYFIKKFTLEGHLKNTKNTKSNYLRHLLGKVNFVLQLNDGDKEMVDYSDFLKAELKSKPEA
ncbi:reverse transcriptase family protein [Pedobacter sp. UC225_65]|uniref:reverse transcriptase family protein n=1 Tax=Pedobacter sp. UC225_65 TaxID=3350173 RepID=UPI003672262C